MPPVNSGAHGGPEVDFEEAKLDIALSADGFIQKSAVGIEKPNYKEITEPFAYVVKESDTYESIAREFDLDVETILSNNRVKNQNYPIKGEILKIPPVKGVIHTIKRGNTLNGIASYYGVDAEKIRRQNNLAIDDTLVVGRELIIPGGTKPKSTQNYYAKQKSYQKPNSYSSTNDTMIKPTNGFYSQYYHRGHYAVDIASKDTPDIWAAKAGTVIEVRTSGWNYGYGKYVIVDHGNNERTLYAHMSNVAVQDGQKVGLGDKLGIMGSTGRSSGTHLHFEVIKNGYKKNPLAYF